MTRYVVRPLLNSELSPWTWGHPEEWTEGKPTPPLMAIERDISEPQPTGLLDKRGNELFRIEERNAIGFHAKFGATP